MALPINIDDLINARTVESVRIEFKRNWNPESIIRTMCAFANDIKEYGGGYIIVGIEEDNGSPILPPAGLKQKDIDQIQKEFVELCFKIDPPISAVIEPVLFQDQYIVVLWVTTGEERPYDAPTTLGPKAQRKIYVRPSSVTIDATKDLEDQLRQLSTLKHFDDRINIKASVEDLDLSSIQAYLQEIKSNLYLESQKIPLSEIALKMQIARGPKEYVRPLNVGLLMFNKEPHNFFSGCRTNLIEFSDEAGTKYSEKTFTGPVHVQIRSIMSYLNTNIIKQFVSKSSIKAESENFFNYPYAALEELVVNSLYHRSYENPTPNEIRIYKVLKKGVDRTEDTRRIELHSYPGPLPPIDDNALNELRITARNYRNIKLGDWLKNLRLAEKYATGIPTVVESLTENGSPRLVLSSDQARSHFLAVIRIHPDTPPDYEPSSELERVILSNDHQRILEFLQGEPLPEPQLREALSFDITEDLNFLISKKLLSEKNLGDLRLLYITKRGVEELRQSF